MTGVQRIYSDMVYEVMSQNYDPGWCRIELNRLHKDVYAFKFLIVDISSPACTSQLVTLTFHPLDHLVADASRFGGVSALDTSRYSNSSTKLLQTRIVTRINNT